MNLNRTHFQQLARVYLSILFIFGFNSNAISTREIIMLLNVHLRQQMPPIRTNWNTVCRLDAAASTQIFGRKLDLNAIRDEEINGRSEKMRIEYRKLEQTQRPSRFKHSHIHTTPDAYDQTKTLSSSVCWPLVSYSKIVCLPKKVKHLHTTSYSRCDTDVKWIKNAQIKW